MVDDEFMGEVEGELGMDNPGDAEWELAKPKEICEAAIKVYVKRLRERVVERDKMSPLD